MKISGFTLVRHGEEFDYPYLESIRSLLPIVDELVVNIGVGQDETENKIKKFAENEPKLKIFVSDWPLNDPFKQKGGQVLSEQTNLVLDRCTGDWCVYLQADEVLHEEDISLIQESLRDADRRSVDAVVFEYIHFYGSYQVIQKTRGAYRREIRAIRRSSGARSVGDAQSFRSIHGGKLSAILSQARVFHYGWVRSPEKMREKTFYMDQMYHGAPNSENADLKIPHTGDNYRYKRFWGLKKFTGTHPAVMLDRIRSKDWNWDLKNSPWVWSPKDIKKIFLDLIEQATGHRFFEYKNYRLVK